MSQETVSRDATLTEEERKKCGAGTPNACFALIMGPNTEGIACGLIAEPQIAQVAGARLGWRTPPVPEGRDRPVCVKGLLENTTTE